MLPLGASLGLLTLALFRRTRLLAGISVVMVFTGGRVPWLKQTVSEPSANGLEVTAFPVGELVNPSAPLTVLDFLPRAAALQHSEIGLRELLSTGYYGIRHGS